MVGVETSSGLREAMQAYSSRFDPAVVTAADATTVMDDMAAIEKMAATVKVLAAAKAAQSGQWRRRGARSPAHDLAQRTGTSVGAAVDALDAATRLGELSVLSGAARRGEVSAQQLAAIADAAHADPGAERRLVESAKASSLAELRNECARTKAAARPRDAESAHAEVHRTRHLRSFTDRLGGWNLGVRNVAERGAEFMSVLRPFQDRVFARARAEGRREPFEAYAADAFAEMIAVLAAGMGRDLRKGPDLVAAGAPAPDADVADVADPGQAEPSPKRSVVPTKIIVRIDFDALVRGFPIDGEVCEIAGIGPVPVSVVRAMMQTGDPFLAAVVTKGVDVANVAHLGRRVTAAQLTAMQWRDPECPVLGCNRSAGLEIDHREDWATTKITLVRLLDRPCDFHHDKKTREGWAFVEGVGKRPMVPPDDPRHPKNKARAGPMGEAEPSAAPECDPPDTGPSRAA